MQLPNLTTGQLPPGRFRMSIVEIEAAWVHAPLFSTSRSRPHIWGHWQRAAQALEAAVPVCAAWLGGSFLSDKLDPGDLDCVWIVEDEVLGRARRDSLKRDLLAYFATSKLKVAGLLVDSFILPWRPRPGATLGDMEDKAYAMMRGYWDDLWQRERSGPKGAPQTRTVALPRRGYAEVELSGFAE
jgi:hypothetical protein